MNFLSAFVLKYLPFCTAFAENTTMSTIVTWAAGIGGGVVALFLIIALAKDGIGLAKGSGDSSILKIIGKALFLILIIGLIYLAVNYDSLGDKAQNIANKGVNIVNNEVNGAL